MSCASNGLGELRWASALGASSTAVELSFDNATAMDRAEAILNRAHNAVVAIDDRGVVTYWNPSAERIFAITRTEAVGAELAELIIPTRFREAHRAGLERVKTGGPARVLDQRLQLAAQRSNGEEFPVEMTIMPAPVETPWSYVAFVADVSERHAAEHERDQLLVRLEGAVRESELRFDAIVGSISDAVTIRSLEHELIYANAAALTQMGFESLDELRAAGPAQIMSGYRVLDAHGGELSMQDIPSVRILEGKPAEPLLIHTVDRKTGVEQWQMLKAAPLLGADGELRATITIIENVTDQNRAERHRAFLSAASDALASSLDYERTLRTVSELAVPEIADWCAVDMLGPAGERVSVAVAHSDPQKLKLAEELRRYGPAELDPDEGLGRVLRTGEPILYTDIPEELLVRGAVDDQHLALIKSVGMRSALVVPMRIADRTLGAMTLVNAESGRTLGEHELDVAAQLATRAAVAIENSRLYTQRSTIAHTLQQSLLPRALPAIPGYELAASYAPAVAGTEVGGDFYDAWEISSGSMVVIGDITGKGIEAASLTARARYTLRTASRFLSSPASLLAHLDEELKQQPPGGLSLCTALCVRLNPAHDHVVLSAGGHPLPLRVTSSGAETVGASGPLIGGLSDPAWTDHAVAMHPGSTLVLYTDGVTDAVGEQRERFGLRRLVGVLGSTEGLRAAEVLQAVRDEVESFEHGPQADDKAMLALTRTVGSAVRAGADREFPTEAAS